MKSAYISERDYKKVLGLMEYENALALRVSLETGARIGDVLALREENLRARTLTYIAEKTGKKDSKAISPQLASLLRTNARNGFLFCGRSGTKPRTRQTVWKDLKRAAQRAGVPTDGFSPHFARKNYAVELFHEKGLPATQKALQHSRADTTMLYAFADILNNNNSGKPPEITINCENIDYFASKIADFVIKRLKSEKTHIS